MKRLALISFAALVAGACGPKSMFRLTSEDNDRGAISAALAKRQLPEQPAPVSRCTTSDIVGEYGMFLSGRRSATLRAAGPTSVLVLDYKHFKRFLLAFPESMLALFATCVERLATMQTKASNDRSI